MQPGLLKHSARSRGVVAYRPESRLKVRSSAVSSVSCASAAGNAHSSPALGRYSCVSRPWQHTQGLGTIQCITCCIKLKVWSSELKIQRVSSYIFICDHLCTY